MHRINFIHQPRRDISPARGLRAILASCAFHGVTLGLLLWMTLVYRSHLPPPSGSAPGAPSITLETMVIVTPPPEPPPPVAVSVPQLPTPVIPPKPPDEGVPVLPSKPTLAVEPTSPKIRPMVHPAIAPTTTAKAPSRLKPTAAQSSSYAPGLNILPHPPYPTEARDRRQTGTVVMNVQFDAQGNVAHAEVAQSSGAPLLDSATRSFIRTHWHSAAYAGQTISQPVQYALENP